MRHLRGSPQLTLLLTTTALLAGACGDGSPIGPREITELPRDLSLSEALLVEASNDFAFRLLEEVYEAAPDSNLFISPLSASVALGMTMNGAAGTTYDEMSATLGFGSLTVDQVNQGYKNLMDLLRNLDPVVEMGIGNSIWYREGLEVKAGFLDRTTNYFDAQVEALDFADPSAAMTINDWVNDATHGKIEEIVESPISRETIMFLINAIYFKADWTYRFDKGKTVQAPFHALDGSGESVLLMRLDGALPYAETDAYQVVDLPYGGKAFSMTVLLPKEGHGLKDLLASLDRSTWSQMAASLQAREGTALLPRFQMEWGDSLNAPLKRMGMETPFDRDQADFSELADGVLPGEVFIKEVKQKTFVEVNEEGTEAAAVTSVEMGRDSASDRFTFRADRPFLFFLREKFSQTILFAGVLVRAPEA